MNMKSRMCMFLALIVIIATSAHSAGKAWHQQPGLEIITEVVDGNYDKVLDIGENRRLNAAVLGAFFAFDDDVPESNMASRFARRLPHRAFPEYAVQGTATLFQQEDA